MLRQLLNRGARHAALAATALLALAGGAQAQSVPALWNVTVWNTPTANTNLCSTCHQTPPRIVSTSVGASLYYLAKDGVGANIDSRAALQTYFAGVAGNATAMSNFNTSASTTDWDNLRQYLLDTFDARVSVGATLYPPTSTPTASFGNVVGGTSSQLTYSVRSARSNNITFSTPTVTGTAGAGSGSFSVGAPSCTTVAGNYGGVCTFTVTYNATTASAGAKSATLNISFAGTAGDPAPRTRAIPLSATTTLPILQLSTTSYAPSTPLNVAATSSDIIITNSVSATANLVLGDMVSVSPFSGTASAEYTLLTGSFSSCTLSGTTLTPGQSCRVRVRFTPTLAGTRLATLTIPGNAGTSGVVNLSGFGETRTIGSIANFNFSTAVLQGSSASTTYTLTNTGNSTMNPAPTWAVTNTVAGDTASDFARSSTTPGTCGTTITSLAAGASCTVVMTFTPATNPVLQPGATSARAGTLTFSSTNATNTSAARITGTSQGLANPTAPAPTAFPDTRVGTTSATTRTLTITNNRANAVAYAAPTLVGTNASEFAVTAESCGTRQVAGSGGTCTLTVSFTPSTGGGAGLRSAAVRLAFSGTGTDPTPTNSPLDVAVSGNGTVAPGFQISATSLAPSAELGTTGPASTLTVTNTGTAPLVLSTLVPGGSFPGDYAFGGTCSNGSSLPANAGAASSCTITASFTPGAVGARGATLTVNHNDSTVNGGATVVTLSGTGTPSLAPVLDLSGTTQLAFGNVNQGTNAQQTVTVRNGNSNVGATAVLINGLSISGAAAGDFTRSGTCTTSTSLGAAQSCTVIITFAPSAAGTRAASLAISTSNAGSATVPLSGTGVAPPDATLSGVPLTAFPSTLVGTTGATVRTVTINNPRTNPITYGTAFGGTNPGDFQVASESCGTRVVPAGGSCTVGLRFVPANGAAGARTANLVFAFIGSGTDPNPSALSTGLAGTAALPAPGFNISSTSLSLSSVAGVPASTATLTISNTGTATLTLTSLALGGSFTADYAQGGTCSNGTVLAVAGQAGASCTVTLVFTPGAVGARNATLNINHNDTAVDAGSTVVTINGTGTASLAPVLDLNGVSQLGFGSVNQGASSQLTLTVRNGNTNIGATALALNSLAITGGAAADFTRGGTCTTSTSLAAGQSCTVLVTFAPGAAGARSASLAVGTSNAGSASVALTGTGVALPDATLSGVPLAAFPSTVIGTTSSTVRTLTINNPRSNSITYGTGFGGTNAADYAVSAESCATRVVPAGGNCTVSVRFTPTSGSAGTRSATLALAFVGAGSDPAPATLTTNLSATAAQPAPAFSVSASSVTISSVVGQSASATTLTVTNNGTASLTLSSLTLGGAFPGDYTRSGTCANGSVLTGPTTPCTIVINFTPGAVGARGATLTINHTDAAVDGGATVVTLNGSGNASLAAVLDLSGVTQLVFGDVALGTSSQQTLTVRNGNSTVGATALVLSGLNLGGAASADYTRGGTCTPTSSLGAGQSCTVVLSFTPSASGARAGTLAVTSSNAGSASVVLSGNGVALPDATLSGVPVAAFPDTLVGTASGTTRTVTINNPRSNPVTYGSAFGGTHAADFSVGSESCATRAVPAGGACTLTLRFAPGSGSAGTRTATLVLAFIGSGTDPNPANLTAAISGSATLPAPAFSISSSSLAATAVVSSSSTTSALITNTGAATLQFSALAFSGTAAADFSLDASNACTATTALAPSANCTLVLRYAPAAAGNANATLTLTSNAAGSPHAVSLAGTATPQPQPRLALSGLSLQFGSLQVGVRSSEQTVVLQNVGDAALNFSAFGFSGTAAGDFTRGGTCAVGTPLAPGGQCELGVSFQPAASGARSASLLVQSDASNGPATLSLAGTGAAAPAPAVTLASALGLPLEFGTQTVGGLYPARRITLSNTGGADLAISALVVEGTGFSRASTTNCPATLGAGDSCAVDISFAPTTAGADFNGTLRVTSNAAGSPHTAALHGRSTAAAVPSLVWEPLVSRLDFGQVTVGNVGATQSATLRNRGPGGATLVLLNAVGADAATFSVAAGDCQVGQTLFEGQSCRIDVRFAPGTAGAKNATVQVAGSGNAPSDLLLSGIGLGGPNPGLALSGSSLSFGTVRVGAQSAPQELTLAANGTGVVRVLALITSDGFAVQTKSCPPVPFTLQAGSECTVTVAFTPRAGGAATGQLTVSSDATQGSTQQVALAGSGEAPAELSSGGCSISRGRAGFDPTLALLALLAAAGLAYRRYQRRSE